MQKASQRANWTEITDNLDNAEIVHAAYFLRFASEMREMQECLAERGGVSAIENKYLCLQCDVDISAI